MEKKFIIRYAFEYGGVCLWGGNELTKNKFGYAIKPESLPLPDYIICKIKELTTCYGSSLNWDNPMGESPWDSQQWEDFMTKSKELFTEIKKELEEDFVVINDMIGEEKSRK